MAGNRKAFTDTVVKWISEIIPKSPYIQVIREQLEGLSDTEFENYVKYLEDNDDAVPIIVPNLSDVKISVERNLEIAKRLGYDFFQHLYLTDPVTMLTYRTPKKYLVLRLPCRRQQQMLEEKISIPDSNRKVDDLTGQPSGASKGASMTFPEIQLLRSQGAYRSLEELIKYRGGDTKGFQGMNRHVMETGGVSLDQLSKTPTTVKSTDTLRTYLTALHLANTL
jgi:hypothetical protein